MEKLMLGDGTIAWHDAGPQVGVPTLLLVHGFPLTHTMWLPLIEALGGSCRTLAPDLRGYGDSTLGTDDGTLAHDADDLAKVLDRVAPTEPVLYVGFSMGGYIAWPFLERYPERVDGLVLMDTKAADDTSVARATRLKMADKVSEWGARRVAELMRPNLFAPGTSQETIDQTVATIGAVDPRAIAASQRAMAARPDVTPRLAEVRLPTLLMVGEEDAISPPEAMRGMADAIPGGELVVIPGAGHLAPVEKPSACAAALLRFIGEL